MKSKILYIAFLLLIPSFAHCTSNEQILINELKSININNPKADIESNTASKNYKFIAINGFAQYCPGIKDEEDYLVKKYGYRVIEGISDVIDSENHVKLIEKVTKYAELYNIDLIEYIKKVDSSYKPVKVVIPKEDHSGAGYFFWAAFLTRHNPIIFSGLLLIGLGGYMYDLGELDWNGMAAGLGLAGFYAYAQTQPNKDEISMIGTSALILGSMILPKEPINETTYVPHINIFQSDEQKIDYTTSKTIYDYLVSNKYIKRKSYYYGEFTDKLTTKSDIDSISLPIELSGHEEYGKWVLLQILLFKNQGLHPGIYVDNYNL